MPIQRTGGRPLSREEKAREGAQAVIPDDTILDIAVVMPRGSTMSGVLGATAGVMGGGGQRHLLGRGRRDDRFADQCGLPGELPVDRPRRLRDHALGPRPGA